MRVIFSAKSGSPVLSVLQGGPAQVTGGVGGWEVAARPKRTSLTRWIGREPMRINIPIVFDSHIEDQSVEDDINLLLNLALPQDAHQAPPIFTIKGSVPHRGLSYVIDEIEWGTNVIWAERGTIRYRTRQDAVVRVLQHVAADYVARAGGPGGLPRVPSRYVIKPGDTLASIALKYYGNRNYWRKIAKLNRMDDPATAKIRPGRGIALPRP